LGVLLAWYFTSGKPQQKYVTERFGKTYPRRGWTKPILATLGVGLAFFAVIFVIAFTVEMLTGAEST
jgi:hypothetical protein